jgi:DNA-binding NarL/FixJ family response regulator
MHANRHLHQEPHRPLRITLAHECELVVRGLKDMLAPYSARVVLVPSQSDGQGAVDVDLTLHDFASRLHRLPGQEVSTVQHSGRLVAFTWYPRPDLVGQAIDAGLAGVLSKNLPPATLVASLEAIHRGEIVVEYGVRPPARENGSSRQLLTPREEDIVRLISQGLDNFSIARETSLSINSVKSHIRSAYRKMGVSSRSQAVLWGVRHGFLENPAADPPTVADRPALTG